MTHVPCNGCTACCKGQRIILTKADRGEKYRIAPTIKGNDGKTQWMLQHKPNGDCIYLGDSGCTIHDRAPKACRDFDCRKWFSAFDPAEQLLVFNEPLDAECARSSSSQVGQKGLIMPVPRNWVIGLFLLLLLWFMLWVEVKGTHGGFGRAFQQGTCTFWHIWSCS